MDADAKPNPNWIHALVTPLTYGPHIGATTGYRYYIPVTGHTANKIVSVLNAQVGSLLGPYRRTFAWGGSMAIRRADFFAFGLAKMWQTALSDDYVLSHCVKRVAKRKIQFVPQCLVASDANFNWASLLEFSVRQYRITKVCEPLIWLTAVGGAILYLTAFCYTLFNSIYGFVPGAIPDHTNQIAMFCGLYLASIVRGFFLVNGGMHLLPEHKKEISTTMLWATIGSPWCYFINLIALVCSGFGRSIVWRGVAYQMVSRTKTIVQRPHAGAPSTVPHRERAEV
jgi:cellulose synthase/poly-beta-1,6-N-acetylglucosamine synthase-like glycosyltransferase